MYRLRAGALGTRINMAFSLFTAPLFDERLALQQQSVRLGFCPAYLPRGARASRRGREFSLSYASQPELARRTA